MTENSGFKDVIDAARRGSGVHQVPGVNGVVHAPNGRDGASRVLDLEALLDVPRRARGTTRVYGALAFCQLLKDAEDTGSTPQVFIDRDPDKPQIVAVLNGCFGVNPGWADHRVEIAFKRTAQWTKWLGMHGRWHTQAVFADFIEENRDDIVDPSGAQMLEIATYLEATKSTSFRSSVRLQNGDIELENLENTEAKVSRGRIAIPETFTLGLAPFVGHKTYQVPARFRYRIEDGKLKLGFLLQRHEDLMKAVVDDLMTAIEQQTGRTWPLEGEPPPVVAPRPVLPID